MPVTEVAIPHLKTDEESRKLFLSKWPEVKKYFLAKPGLTRAYSGWLTHENNKSVEDDFRFIFVVEWTSLASFEKFLASPELKEFGGILKPLFTASPSIEVYKTDVGTLVSFAKPITEIIRVKLADESKIPAAEQAWQRRAHLTALARGSNPYAFGPSANLDENIFCGIVGWDSMEERQENLDVAEVKDALEKLSSIGEMSSIVVKVSLFIGPS